MAKGGKNRKPKAPASAAKPKKRRVAPESIQRKAPAASRKLKEPARAADA
jgi:hypothetical protein